MLNSWIVWLDGFEYPGMALENLFCIFRHVALCPWWIQWLPTSSRRRTCAPKNSYRSWTPTSMICRRTIQRPCRSTLRKGRSFTLTNSLWAEPSIRKRVLSNEELIWWAVKNGFSATSLVCSPHCYWVAVEHHSRPSILKGFTFIHFRQVFFLQTWFTFVCLRDMSQIDHFGEVLLM